MKMRNLVLFFLLVPFASYGQDRVNGILPVVSDSIYTLRHADGWIYSESDNQWTKRENDIIGYDDFKKIEIRKMSYENQDYLILLKYIDDGYFDYPTINQGFHSTVNINYYVFKQEDVINSINSIKDSIFVLKLNEKYKGSILESQLNELNRDIVQSPIDKSKNRDLFIQIQLSKSKNYFRFLFFEKQCYFPDWVKANERTPDNQICSYSRKKDEKIYEFDRYFKKLGTDSIFTALYFETENAEFDKFIKSLR